MLSSEGHFLPVCHLDPAVAGEGSIFGHRIRRWILRSAANDVVGTGADQVGARAYNKNVIRITTERSAWVRRLRMTTEVRGFETLLSPGIADEYASRERLNRSRSMLASPGMKVA